MKRWLLIIFLVLALSLPLPTAAQDGGCDVNQVYDLLAQAQQALDAGNVQAALEATTAAHAALDYIQANCPVGPTGTVSKVSANVRETPGGNPPTGTLIGQVPGGYSAALVGQAACDDGFTWWQIDYNGQPGWIREDLLSVAGDAVSVPVIEGACSVEPPSVTGLVIADFNAGTGVNNLGGSMGAAYESPNMLAETYPEGTARLEYNITDWVAFWMTLQGVDLSPYSQLQFDIRADSPVPARMKVELKRAGLQEMSVIYVSGISSQWQTMRVNLSAFQAVEWAPALSSLTGMEELVFTFEAAQSGSTGVVYIDNIQAVP